VESGCGAIIVATLFGRRKSGASAIIFTVADAYEQGYILSNCYYVSWSIGGLVVKLAVAMRGPASQ
jgi:hypothetical protein